MWKQRIKTFYLAVYFLPRSVKCFKRKKFTCAIKLIKSIACSDAYLDTSLALFNLIDMFTWMVTNYGTDHL